MGFIPDAAEMLRLYVGVDFGGGDSGVAEHFLYSPQIGPAGQHVGGE
jgi:hypothetical protein